MLLGCCDLFFPASRSSELEVGHRARQAEQIPLRMGAARSAHEHQLILRFNALGDGPDRQAMAETIAVLSALFSSSRTNERSILILPKGNRRKCVSEE